MDTGYVQLIDDATRRRVLEMADACTSGEFVAGAYVADEPGSPFDLGRHLGSLSEVEGHHGTPVVFPSYGLNSLEPDAWVEAHRQMGRHSDRFLGFELGPMFVPYGRIYPLEAYRGLMEIPSCIGAKHSSLSRELEWQRLELRDDHRPGFLVLTGNDLAIDMVMYGSDYLLGISTFAPDLFAKRDALWAAGDPGFFQLNDVLQYLGFLTFRHPVPGYRHSAAMFLHLQGWAKTPLPHLGCPTRPESDIAILSGILDQLAEFR
jgi:hypothetical protein